MSEELVAEFFTEKEAAEKEVLAYGLTVLLSTLGSYLLIIVVSSLLGVRALALTAAITASLIKIFSGGIHATCFRNCSLTAVTVFAGIGLVANYLGSELGESLLILLWGILLIGSLLIYLYAPAGIKEKPIKSVQKRSKFKIYSFIVFLSFLVLYYILYFNGINKSLILAGLLGISWQLFGITPLAYKLFGREYLREVKTNEA
ncbi:accessory gene regulator ArgB-like protein [Fuchsiella alkaliacetigena]|uniref:accessory gene regulator ArgB-like protein n=1 Tax=Fuchsiella alkaliacetigena TaxID=957042 RepID=UPI00200ADC3C|nr:accessory gene regulator B family protein [Fuchsiella alkaliacetigena]MCK8824558.1 accessory gene regulator B family protein [Fuchsiella alkaliacetigena]